MREAVLGDYNEQETFLNKLYYCGNCNIEMQKVSLLGRCATCLNSGNISIFKCPSCNKKVKVFQGDSCISCDEILNVEK